MLPIVTDLVTIVRAAKAVGYGNNTTLDWGPAAARTTVEACVQPAGAGESTNGGADRVSTRIQVFLHPGTDVTATDRIEWDDQLWRIDGTPAVWPDPTGGSEHHIEVTATRVTGG
ncbi:head-tail adaptor protein [Actinomadura sp. 3N508]|uniref:phage head completion protein n=1 Tax=Actinomadura sp. 3N508 TaxID=3375153 RepID=UPI0037A93E01